jgi:septal ring factor EnvC (AmiA/AmiB activator)
MMLWAALLLVGSAAAEPPDDGKEPPVGSLGELSKLLGEEFDILLALDQLDADRRRQEKALVVAEEKRIEMIGRRDRAEFAHNEAKVRLDRDRERIRGRIRVYIDLKRVKDWQILASAGDYANYLRMKHLFRELVKGDEERIKAYHKVVDGYRVAKEKLDAELIELRKAEQALNDAQAKLERDKAVREALLESVRTDKEFYAKAGKDLDKAAEQLETQVSNFAEWTGKRLWFRDLKGQYSLPVPAGSIAQLFGKIVHPRWATVTMHRGIDIVPGRKGDKEVRCIYWGRVVYAGWLKGYGNTVIVDHTQGDYTLYAHLERIDVKVGDVLESRQALGVLGKTGSFESERLYFELRLAGKPVDPVPWFR